MLLNIDVVYDALSRLDLPLEAVARLLRDACTASGPLRTSEADVNAQVLKRSSELAAFLCIALRERVLLPQYNTDLDQPGLRIPALYALHRLYIASQHHQVHMVFFMSTLLDYVKRQRWEARPGPSVTEQETWVACCLLMSTSHSISTLASKSARDILHHANSKITQSVLRDPAVLTKAKALDEELARIKGGARASMNAVFTFANEGASGPSDPSFDDAKAAAKELFAGEHSDILNLLEDLSPDLISAPTLLPAIPNEVHWMLRGQLSFAPISKPNQSRARRYQEALQLLDLARSQSLTSGEVRKVVKELEANPSILGGMRLDPDELKDLVESNPGLSLEIIGRLLGTKKGDGYLDMLLNLPVTLHTLELVNDLVEALPPDGEAPFDPSPTSAAAASGDTESTNRPDHAQQQQQQPARSRGTLRRDFIRAYVSRAVESCDRIRDASMQGRQVRLVCAFVQSLIRKGGAAVEVGTLEVEVQAFCLQFSRVAEAAALFRVIKQMEDGGGGVTHVQRPDNATISEYQLHSSLFLGHNSNEYVKSEQSPLLIRTTPAKSKPWHRHDATSPSDPTSSSPPPNADVPSTPVERVLERRSKRRRRHACCLALVAVVAASVVSGILWPRIDGAGDRAPERCTTRSRGDLDTFDVAEKLLALSIDVSGLVVSTLRFEELPRGGPITVQHQLSSAATRFDKSLVGYGYRDEACGTGVGNGARKGRCLFVKVEGPSRRPSGFAYCELSELTVLFPRGKLDGVALDIVGGEVKVVGDLRNANLASVRVRADTAAIDLQGFDVQGSTDIKAGTLVDTRLRNGTTLGAASVRIGAGSLYLTYTNLAAVAGPTIILDKGSLVANGAQIDGYATIKAGGSVSGDVKIQSGMKVQANDRVDLAVDMLRPAEGAPSQGTSMTLKASNGIGLLLTGFTGVFSLTGANTPTLTSGEGVHIKNSSRSRGVLRGYAEASSLPGSLTCSSDRGDVDVTMLK
ncbi:hypothetical protein HK101_009610 [Irineochytrium annulatum]|nr:hypothetical protein HK101_009610 [Irineochytrium annulatum]